MKTTKEEVMRAMKNLRDKDAVESIKQHFYVESVKATCWKACEVYGFDKGFDMALELTSFLLSRNMLSLSEVLEITTEVALMDYDEKEGDKHGKD